MTVARLLLVLLFVSDCLSVVNVARLLLVLVFVCDYLSAVNVCDRQYYKLGRSADERLRSSSALSDCVNECTSWLREAVQQLTDTHCDSSHPLNSLLQLSSDESRTALSVTSDEPFIAYESLSDGNCVVAVCTPLMKRVHRLVPQAAEIAVVDMGHPVDKRRRCRVVVLATSSSAGGLPLGVIATTSDSSLQRAVELYASLLDPRCFYGRGLRGPTLLLVDDCQLLRTALCGVFTASACLVCSYRLLVSFWRELWDRRSAVSVEQRPRCFALYRAAVLADTVDQLHARFADVQSDCAMVSSASSLSHVMAVYERRAEWSVCCQKPDWSVQTCVRTAGANRGLCGYASRTLKDSVVDYIKSMKTVETLLTFVSRRCDAYYERRLTDTVTGRLDDASALRFMQECQVNADVMSTVPPSQFHVTLQPSSVVVSGDMALTCHVELSVGLCSCSVGCSGASCVHQWAAILQTQARFWLLRPVSSTAAQRVLAHIATGLGYAEMSWFASLHPLQCCDDVLLTDDCDGDGSTAERLIAAEETVEAFVAQPDVQSAPDVVISSLPVSAAAADVSDNNKHIIINWNGLAYEVSLQEQETLMLESNDALPTPSHNRLRQALSKIENAYLNHPDVMETAVSTFSHTVESIEILEHLNSALLCFGNSFLTSGSAAFSWS